MKAAILGLIFAAGCAPPVYRLSVQASVQGATVSCTSLSAAARQQVTTTGVYRCSENLTVIINAKVAR